MTRRDYKARRRRAMMKLVEEVSNMEIPLDEDPEEIRRQMIEEFGFVDPPPPLPPHLKELDERIREAADLRLVNLDLECPKIARFEALEALGRGGYGLVYLVRDPELDRLVALKLCPALQPEATELFTREAQILGSFSHPNLVTVHETGYHEGEFFYVMEYVPDSGTDLVHEWEEWEEVVAIYLDAAAGLAAAHEEGIVHRDFKPANVLIGEDGRARVADFGLARLIDGGAPGHDARAESYRAGTFLYMAPEVLRGRPNDAKSDQWSFFVALWLTVEGELPFKGSTADEVLASIDRRGPLMSKIPRRVPVGLHEIMCRGLSTDPDKRLTDMNEVIHAMRRLVRPPPPKPPPKPPGSSSPPWETIMLGVLIAAGSVLGTLGWVDMRQRPEQELPCALSALDGSAADLDPVVLDVCDHIRNNKFDDADHAWSGAIVDRQRRNHDRVRSFQIEGQTQMSPAEVSAAAEVMAGELAYRLEQDTLIVARTYVDQAQKLQRAKQTEDAKAAAISGRVWVERAAVKLGEEYPGLTNIRAQVDQIAPMNTER